MMIFIVVVLFLVAVSIKNSNHYKVNKDIDSKYLYITVDGENTKVLTVENNKDNNLSVSKGSVVALSLLENATIVTKWEIKYDQTCIEEVSNETRKVSVHFFNRKDGVDHTRREIKLECIASGKTIISLVYGDFLFNINLAIK